MKKDLNYYAKTLEELLVDIDRLWSFEATASTFCQEVADNIDAIDFCCHQIKRYLSTEEISNGGSSIYRFLENVSSITYDYVIESSKIKKITLLEIKDLLGRLIDQVENLIYFLAIRQR